MFYENQKGNRNSPKFGEPSESVTVIIFQPTEGLQVPSEFQLMLSMNSNFCEEDQYQNHLDYDLIDWSTNDFGESEDDDDNDILVILVISMIK